jgi:hypothetical protein
MVVRRFECCYVSRTHFTGIPQVGATPGEPLSAQLHDEQVGHQTGVTAVAVRKWMDGDEPVMKTHRDLVRGIRLVFDPPLNLIEELA